MIPLITTVHLLFLPLLRKRLQIKLDLLLITRTIQQHH